MRNLAGVIAATIGVAGLVWGTAGSLRAAVAVAGAVLAAGAVLLLIDVSDGRDVT